MNADNKQGSAMGHDPLAWIAQDEDEEGQVEAPQEQLSEEVAETPVSDASEPEGTPPEVIETAIELAERAATGALVALEGDMGIANINDWHGTFQEALMKETKVTLQAEELTHVDTAAMQLLYAFVRDAKKSEVEVIWKSVPDSVKKTAEVLGVSELMGW